MTKQHDISYYQDGYAQVAYCRKCSAEGQKLLEDCPQKIEIFVICSDCGGSGIDANIFDGEICENCKGKGRFLS